MNTRIFYMYRDADNYKQNEEIILNGEISEEEIDTIFSKLDEGLYFIPSQVGLNDLQERMCSDIGDSDHVWHELIRGDINHTEDNPTPNHPFSDVHELVERFRQLERWDEIEAASDLGII